MQCPPTSPGHILIKFHFVDAASITSFVSISMALNIFASSLMKAMLTSLWAFSIIFYCCPIRWVLIIIFFEILIPPEPFMRDAPHFFYRKYNLNSAALLFVYDIQVICSIGKSCILSFFEVRD